MMFGLFVVFSTFSVVTNIALPFDSPHYISLIYNQSSELFTIIITTLKTAIDCTVFKKHMIVKVHFVKN